MILQPLFFALKGIPPVNYEKKPNDIAVFLYNFHNVGPNLAKILPQNHTHFNFFLLVSNEIC